MVRIPGGTQVPEVDAVASGTFRATGSMNLPSPAHFQNQSADARVTEAEVPRYFTGGFRAVPQALQYSVLILGAEGAHAKILVKRGEAGNGQPVIVTVSCFGRYVQFLGAGLF